MDPRTASLARVVRGEVSADPADLERCGRDGSHVVGRPSVVFRPRDADDLAVAVRWAAVRRIPVVARGAGTSLDGESVPVRGGIVVDLAAWNEIREIDPIGRWARAGPGTPNRTLQRALASHHLFFPPNPGSWAASTLGGNVATNASGPRSFRYGPTRTWIRAVDLVLGTGTRTRWGSLAAKRSVGPDLLSVFVGSEGTLGIATEITVRLAARPPVRRGFAVPMTESASLGRVAIALASAPGTGLSAIEYLDPDCCASLGLLPTSLGCGSAGLLLEIEAGDPEEATVREDRVLRVARGAGVVGPPVRYADSDRLWDLRGRASVALDRRVGERLREDVAVPLRAIDRLCATIRRIARREAVPVYLFGHLGEGSLHPNFVVDPRSAAARRIRADLLRASLALGGTISAEHGIGVLKAPFLTEEVGAPGLAVLRAIKRACDPAGILNPGKLYPARAAARSSRSPSGSGGRTARSGTPSGGPRPSSGRGPRHVVPRKRGARP